MSTTIHTQDPTLAQLTKPWHTTANGKFSVDHVIDAYNTGKQKGLSDAEEILKKAFISKFATVHEISIKFFLDLQEKTKELGDPVQMRLKINSPSNFEVSYVLSEDYFFDHKRNLIVTGDEIELEAGQSDINLQIHFLPSNENLNLKALISDGFVLEYGE